MAVEKILELMDKVNVTQKKLAELLTEKTGKRYNQSMISKRLQDDKYLRVPEVEEIMKILTEFEIKMNGEGAKNM